MAEQLYSFQGKEPESLPEKVRLLDSRLNISTKGITKTQLRQAGWFGPFEKPVDYNERTQVVEWSAEDMQWIIRDKNKYELIDTDNNKWIEVRQGRDYLLARTDGKILMFLERDGSVPEEWKTYRQLLRDIPQMYQNPFEVRWPVEPFPEQPAPDPVEERQEGAPKPRARRKRSS